MARPNILTRRILFILALTAAAVWAQFLGRPESTSFPLAVYVFDVGQGDAILIRTKDGTDLLIDGGPDKTILDRMGEVLPSSDRTIEAVLLTHPHADHVAGLIPVLERFQVGQVWSTGAIHTTDVFLEWLQVVQGKGIPFKIAKEGEALDLGNGIRFTVLFPFVSLEGVRAENLNDTSAVGRLTLGGFSMFLPGDAESTVQEQLFTQGTELRSKVLKVSHHGSSDATSESLLERVNPEVAIISVGADNSFHHPHPSVVRLLEEKRIKTYRTDRDGTVIVETDGIIFTVSTR